MQKVLGIFLSLKLARLAGLTALAGLVGLVGLVGIGTVSAQNILANSDKTTTASDVAVGRSIEAPINTRPVQEKFWWDNGWYDDGRLPVPGNHKLIERTVSYTNPVDGTDVPGVIIRPVAGPGKPRKFPAIIFQHGRRGLDEFTRKLARRMAAQGFVVLAPDLYQARFIAKFPVEHLPETEGDLNAGIDFLLQQGDVSTSRICLYSHTRGGYYALKVAVSMKRQEKDVACFVSFYPHWQDPNLAEPMQVYRYATDADRLTIPTRIFMGEYEQYQRRRSIETAVRSMKKLGRDVKLIVYPGVGRGFDFRPPNVRTFADDLATKDATLRAAAFMHAHLK